MPGDIFASSLIQITMFRRVYLGMNRIQEIDKDAFKGVEGSLELLDLERNSINNISRSISFTYYKTILRKLFLSLAIDLSKNRHVISFLLNIIFIFVIYISVRSPS